MSRKVLGKGNFIEKGAMMNMERIEREEKIIHESRMGVGLEIMVQRQGRSQTWTEY